MELRSGRAKSLIITKMQWSSRPAGIRRFGGAKLGRNPMSLHTHLGFLPDFSPLKSGYDHFFGIYGCCADYFNHGPDASRSGDYAYQLHEEEVPVERHGYMTNLLGDRAVQTIDRFS